MKWHAQRAGLSVASPAQTHAQIFTGLSTAIPHAKAQAAYGFCQVLPLLNSLL